MRLVLLRAQTDERLVALARQGQPRAFEAIVRRYRRPLLASCRRSVPAARAGEILEQALGEAWIRVRREEVNELAAWLCGIVWDAAMRRSGHALVDAVRSVPGSAEEAGRRAVVHETLATLARLPEPQRATLLRSACAPPRGLRRSRLARARTVASLMPLSWLGSGTGEPRIAELVSGSTRTLVKARPDATPAGSAMQIRYAPSPPTARGGRGN